jgi:hypothetical protein
MERVFSAISLDVQSDDNGSAYGKRNPTGKTLTADQDLLNVFKPCRRSPVLPDPVHGYSRQGVDPWQAVLQA